MRAKNQDGCAWVGHLAVIGCRDATMRPKTSDYVHVDGGYDTVEIFHA